MNAFVMLEDGSVTVIWELPPCGLICRVIEPSLAEFKGEYPLEAFDAALN